MSDATPTPVELQVLQLVALWRQGPAVRHDPVLANMFARLTAALNRSAPGVAARVLGTLGHAGAGPGPFRSRRLSMGRYKGMSSKSSLTVEDLVELVDIYRRLQTMHAGLNPVSTQRFPVMAAAATVKAAWAEVSGAEQGWSFPAEYVIKPGERKPTGV